MKQKQKRTEVVKGYLTDDEKAAFDNACGSMRKTASDVLRECTIVIIRKHLDAQPKRNDTPPYTGGARPKPREFRAQFFPAQRPSFGVVPRMRYTV